VYIKLERMRRGPLISLGAGLAGLALLGQGQGGGGTASSSLFASAQSLIAAEDVDLAAGNAVVSDQPCWVAANGP
jgi:hypothetical protein